MVVEMSKYYGIIGIILVGVLIASAVALAPSNDGSDGDDVPVTMSIADMFDRNVTVPTSMERVVVVGGVLNHMNWLQAIDKVVGVEEIETRPDNSTGSRVYRWAYPGYKDLPNVGPAAQPNAENIATANPQVVLYASLTMDAVVTLQDQMNVPVVGLLYPEFGTDNTNFYKQLRLVAKILDREARAEALIDWIESTLDDLEERSSVPAGHEKESCYVGGILQGPTGTGITSTMPYYPPFTMIDAENVIGPDDLGLLTPGSLGRYTVDIEFIVVKDPEVIFLDRAGFGPTLLQYQNNEVVLDQVEAIESDGVYGLLPWHSYNNNVETMFINAYYIGTILYPDGFGDIDPEQKANEIYNLWYGTDVYPELTDALGGGLGTIVLN
jgi:iron complex transport system substrate-binding protein